MIPKIEEPLKSDHDDEESDLLQPTTSRTYRPRKKKKGGKAIGEMRSPSKSRVNHNRHSEINIAYEENHVKMSDPL
jgi:hypothetical protein